MDDLQTAPSNNKIIMWAIVALVIIGIIILIVALVNSSQSSNSNNSSSDSSNSNTFNEDDDDNFNGNNRPSPDYSLNSIGEAARHADLASVEDFHIAGSEDHEDHHESSESHESPKNSSESHESPKNSHDHNNTSENVSFDLHSSSNGVLINSDSNSIIVKEVVVDNSNLPTSLPSNDTIKVSEFTNAQGPSDSLPEMSELSPSELDIVNEFEKKGQSEEFQLSSPLLNTMNKSQNQETPVESHHMKILAPIFDSKNSDVTSDNSELTIDNSVTNAASLSSDFSNPTEASVKKPTKKTKKNDNHSKGFAELTNLGRNPYRK